MKIAKMNEITRYGWRTSLYSGIEKAKTVLFSEQTQDIFTNEVGGIAYIIPMKEYYYLVETQDREKVKGCYAVPKRTFDNLFYRDKSTGWPFLMLEEAPKIGDNLIEQEIAEGVPEEQYPLIEGIDVFTYYNIKNLKEYFRLLKISSKKFNYNQAVDEEEINRYKAFDILYKKIVQHIKNYALWLDFGEILLPAVNKSRLLRKDKVLKLPFLVKHPIKYKVLWTPMDHLNYLTYNTPIPAPREVIEEYPKLNRV